MKEYNCTEISGNTGMPNSIENSGIHRGYKVQVGTVMHVPSSTGEVKLVVVPPNPVYPVRNTSEPNNITDEPATSPVQKPE